MARARPDNSIDPLDAGTPHFRIVVLTATSSRVGFFDADGSEIFRCVCRSTTLGLLELQLLREHIAHRCPFARHLTRGGSTYFLLITRTSPPLMARSVDFATVEARERAIAIVQQNGAMAPAFYAEQ
jgi:hypothetical protein